MSSRVPLPPHEVATSATPRADWVLELHVDRRWYERRRSPEPIPAPGQPRTRALEPREHLVGRGRGPHDVDVDLRPDNGVSRRHAMLDFSEGQWWVTDLGSHNGTWVTRDESRLPSAPITARTALLDGSCIFLGSWSRLVLRRAGGPARGGLRSFLR